MPDTSGSRSLVGLKSGVSMSRRCVGYFFLFLVKPRYKEGLVLVPPTHQEAGVAWILATKLRQSRTNWAFLKDMRGKGSPD